MDIDLFCEIARFLHEKKYNEFIVYELNKIFIKMVYYKINTKTPYNNYSDHKINVKQIIGEDFKSNYPNISENTIKRDINKALEEIKYVFNTKLPKNCIIIVDGVKYMRTVHINSYYIRDSFTCQPDNITVLFEREGCYWNHWIKIINNDFKLLLEIIKPNNITNISLVDKSKLQDFRISKYECYIPENDISNYILCNANLSQNYGMSEDTLYYKKNIYINGKTYINVILYKNNLRFNVSDVICDQDISFRSNNDNYIDGSGIEL